MIDNATRYGFSRQEYACDLTVEAPMEFGRNMKGASMNCQTIKKWQLKNVNSLFTKVRMGT
jgi:hypothetical protein